MSQTLTLAAFSFEELLTVDGLHRLDQAFLSYLEAQDTALHQELLAYRSGELLAVKALSDCLIRCAPILEQYLAWLFDIEPSVAQLQAATLVSDPIFAFKKWFVLREARRAIKQWHMCKETFEQLDQWLQEQLNAQDINHRNDNELSVAQWGQTLLNNPTANEANIHRLVLWCVGALLTEAGQARVAGWVSFHFPRKLNYEQLVNTTPCADYPGRVQAPMDHQRERNGFTLTDTRYNRRQVMDEVHYCVYCHKNEGDFCSKGFPIKKNNPEVGLKVNPLGEVLTGCPLDEKVSEMQFLKKEGYSIAALAVTMIDNPMCPATGHRICNDCMKACIYQRQEPVDIPQIETRILTDVLSLPWGVEIYDLLTRWNPLKKRQYLPKSYNGKKVLVMGLGPAGFSLAYHLLMEGFAVVGCDGLKIEPVDQRYNFNQPILHYQDVEESLDQRVMMGFGGVAEYGITVRWDKNFLKLIYISLIRRTYFQLFGNVRFGGTLTVEDAWSLGFDHLSIAVGAGLPRELSIPHSLAPGMRQANDFLMALQLTGAAKANSLANLQVRLPAVIIGGGLTGIDTATEVQAYYIAQVEKVLKRYQQLSNYLSESVVRNAFSKNDLLILDEWLSHAALIIQERQQAQREHRKPQFKPLVQQWGGVTVAYRRRMQASPAYRRNDEELTKALEEGVLYAEVLEPRSVTLDETGHVKALVCEHPTLGQYTLPARSIFVATGAQPNIAYEYEHKGTFAREENNHYQTFQWHAGHLTTVTSEEVVHCKNENIGMFTDYEKEGRYVSFLGDTHPGFHGSVVKAIASARKAYPSIADAILNCRCPEDTEDIESYDAFKQRMQFLFSTHVKAIHRQHSQIVEYHIHAPMAARHFRPGQFYRLQNYESFAPTVEDTQLQTESVAVLGARVSNDPDCLSLMLIERGASARLLATLQPGQPVALMGPTGCYSHLPSKPHQSILFIGEHAMTFFLLRSLGPALREAGHRILYVAILKHANDIFCEKELFSLTDKILWITKPGTLPVATKRTSDISVSGELTDVLMRYQQGDYTHDATSMIPLTSINNIYLIGSADLLRTMHAARSTMLKSCFSNQSTWIASVYGPMQCMMKGVCAQCLQWQVDPKTGKRTKAVYACSWQHQPFDKIDITNIEERLSQNHVLETLSQLWVDYLFETKTVSRIS